MSFLDKLIKNASSTSAEYRLEEELMYKHVLEEMENDVVREGLYAKALANSDGDESKAKSLYMKYRVRSIRDSYSLNNESYLSYYLRSKQQELLRQSEEDGFVCAPIDKGTLLVKDIYVSEGQYVKKNDNMAYLESPTHIVKANHTGKVHSILVREEEETSPGQRMFLVID